MSLHLRLVAVCLLTACLGTAQAQVTTSVDFTRYFGDTRPEPSIGAETFVNGVLVVPYAPPVIVNGVLQGELDLPGLQSSVEFKNGDAAGTVFNTPSVISFAPFVAMPASETDTFKFGTLSVTNGIFFFQANFDLTFTTSAPNGAYANNFFSGRSFSDTLQYVVTSNDFVLPNGDPDHERNADYVVFQQRPQLGQIRVYELASGLGNFGTVDLYGRAGSLIPLYFANPTGGVFIATAVAPVPEPEVALMLGSGLLALACARRRQRRTGSAVPSA